ncbi:hypothetical protein C7447_102123 [Tenacibaculum adriaticum]|uniref:Uncharacterized protein n=1 Tax=Tenacibaculum adriaticum TaxID=413713 RepID=A0A5S5DTW1_9FLAO|nr:hypothetical protein [Tenacibaculum adriaticum]TYP98808.1 hypothetical protein C7447_102123 [Tenacibaculum adriaticum]
MKKQEIFNLFKFAIIPILITILLSSCEKDNEYINISNSSENKLLNTLIKSTNKDSIFKPNEIKWSKLRIYSTETGYFISIPAISEDGNNKGKVMFEIIETAISKKYLIYSLNSSIVKNINNGLNFDTHDLLNYLNKEKNQKSPNVYNKSSDFPNMGNACAACHSGMLSFEGNELDEVIIDGSSGDDWANDPDNPINDPWGQPTLGGTVTVGTWSSGDEIVAGPDTPINDVNDFLDCFDSAQGATLTVYVNEPNPGSGDTHNGTFVGHTFVSIQQGNNVSTFGYYPVSNYIYPSINNSSSAVLGDDGSGNETFSANISTTVTGNQLQQILDASINFNATYHLDTYNCTDFAIELGNLAGMNLPESNGNWPGGGGSNPGTLGQHIRNLNTANNISTNTTGGNAPATNKGC